MKRKLHIEKIFRILVVENDPPACSIIKEALEKEGYIVNILDRGDYVLDEIQILRPDLVILEMDLPDVTGWEVLRLIRDNKLFISIPVISISAKYVQSLHAIRALSEFGADDYVSKPFDKEILISRIKALLRRKSWDSENESRIIKNGSIKLDTVTRQLLLKGRAIQLTNTEFKILLELVRNKGIPLDRAYLMERIMGYASPEVETRAVDKHVESLRRKLQEYSGKLITVREVGYKFFILSAILLLTANGLQARESKYYKKAEYLIKTLEEDPRNSTAKESLDAAIRKIMALRTDKNKKEACSIMKCAAAKINEAFKKAVNDYENKRYLLAQDGFKSTIAYKPKDKRAEKYIYKILNQMSLLSNYEVAPDAEKLAYAKGFICYNSGEFVNAVSEWERVLNINPFNPEVKQYLEKVKNYLREMIERERFGRLKSMTETVYERACVEYGAGNYEKAIEKWEKVVAISDREKANFFEELGSKSRKQISTALAKISKNAGVSHIEIPEKDIAMSEKYYKEGLELYSLGRIRDAVTRWDLSIRFNPSNEKARKAKEDASREAGIEQ